MSERIGMADGRCITESTSSRILYDFIVREKGVPYQDGHRARMLLQSQGPEGLSLPVRNAACSGPTPVASPLVSRQ
jgi:hypothetical protein